MVNSVALEGDGCNICSEAEAELMEISHKLNCSREVGDHLNSTGPSVLACSKGTASWSTLCFFQSLSSLFPSYHALNNGFARLME